MTGKSENNVGVDNRLDWVEPEVRVLSVSETAIQPGIGPDGETIWTDCTLS
jgi:hypothetical protein